MTNMLLKSKKKRIVLIVQARMSSSRLPGKVLKRVLGKPLLELQIERLKGSQQIHELVIATSQDSSDDPIEKLCVKLKTPCFRGSLKNVLERYYLAARQFQADCVIRVTGDCPLIDPQVVDSVVEHFLQQNPSVDYCSNILDPTFPRGMDTEIFTMPSLERTYREASKEEEREHVTPYIYHSGKFAIVHYKNSQDLSHLRWTVDEESDLTVVRQIFEALYPQNNRFTLNDCLEFIRQNPSITSINQRVKQKKLGE